jgi:hypothetical protein
MAQKPWKAHPVSKPTSITTIARTYHACALALAQTLGLPLAEVLVHHRESVTAVFIECGKREVHLPAGVQLSPLTTVGRDLGPATNVAPAPPPMADSEVPTDGAATNVAPEPEPLPTLVPAGLPCAGKPVTALTPAQLRMLLSRVDQLAAEQGSRWRPLLEGLAAERASRVAKGQKRPVLVPVEGDGRGR